MRELNKISESLFEKIRDRFEDVSLGDENAKATQDPEAARFFNFDYIVDGKNYGNITLSLIDETSLKVYFSKNISHSLSEEDRKQWYGFLRELREFAKRNILSFEPRDITRSTLKHRDIQQQSKADSTYTKDEVVSESRLYGTTKSSYENDGDVKIILRHSDRVDPEQRGARSRKIKAIFIETAEGERLRLPHNNLRYARAMAQHVNQGGQLNDDFGQHITRIAEECSKLRPFKSQMIRRTFEDQETQAMVEAAFEYHGLLNNTLKKMSGSKGYAACKESFQMDEETLMDDFDVDSMRERFVRKTYNDATDSALPIVQKAYKMKKQNKFAEQFESWANNVAEGWDDSEDAQQWGKEPINVDDLAELFAEELPLGVDAANATSSLNGIINSDELESKLVAAAQEDPTIDARDIIIGWLEENVPAVYQELVNEIGDQETPDQYSASGMDEPNVNEGEYDEDQVESIQSAIIHRILGNVSQHSELIKRAGPDGIMNAARDVASFHAPVEELGSSDISAMVREVYNEVGVDYPEMTEADSAPLRKTSSPNKKARDAKYYDYLARTLGEGKVKEVAMDLEELTDEEFQAKYGKTKQEMQQALSESVGMSDELAAKKIANKIQGTPNLNPAVIKQYVTKYLPMVNKQTSDVDYIASLVISQLEDSGLAETQGQDYVNKKEKLAKAGAHRAPRQPEQSFMDKVKSTAKGAAAWVQGKDDSMYESEENSLAEMRRLAGLK